MGRRRRWRIESIYPIRSCAPLLDDLETQWQARAAQAEDVDYGSRLPQQHNSDRKVIPPTTPALLAALVVARDLHRPATPWDDDLPTSVCRPSSIRCGAPMEAPHQFRVHGLIPFSRVRASGTYLVIHTIGVRGQS